MDEKIADFLDHLRCEKGLSSNTIEAYGRDVQAFASMLGHTEWRLVHSDSILQFLGHLKDKNFASSSICRALVSVKIFFRFLKKEGIVDVDPGRYFNTPKTWQLIPDVLTIEEVDALLSQPKSDDFQGARDKAILELLYATGMRVSELCKLRICDLDDTFVKVHGKGKKD